MIFVTVGSQLPFDRLIKAVDQWAGFNSSQSVFAQIGLSDYRPQYIDYCQMLTPKDYEAYCQKADLIISHAGTGTILSALEIGKPLLMMPRLKNAGEIRNDHQLATAKYFPALANITIVPNEMELIETLSQFIIKPPVLANGVQPSVSPDLINAIQAFIHTMDSL